MMTITEVDEVVARIVDEAHQARIATALLLAFLVAIVALSLLAFI